MADAARSPGRFELPAEAAALGELYGTLYRLTDGAMTPLSAAAWNAWATTPATPCARAARRFPRPRWEDVLDWQGTALTTRPRW